MNHSEFDGTDPQSVSDAPAVPAETASLEAASEAHEAPADAPRPTPPILELEEAVEESAQELHEPADAEAEDAPSMDEPEEAAEENESVDRLAAAPACVRFALERRGFRELTKVQLAVAHADGAERDLQISSQTGSGKTVAVGFALAEVLAKAGPQAGRGDGPTALVLTPTRELANQVAREFEWLFADLEGVEVAVVTGGTNVQFEVRKLHRGPRVVVGTPGRMLDHIKSGALDPGGVEEVVLDEADQMLDMGFRDELQAILDTTPEDRRTHLVSATFPPGIQAIAERYQKEPMHVEGTRLGEANADIEHVAFLVHAEDRYAALLNLLLLEGDQNVLVFVNTRQDASDIAAALARDGFAAVPLSGELAQSQRTRTLESFRSGVVRVLVATDVAARGLDLPAVGVVLHASTPRDPETYTHRSGRTGRAGQKGKSLLMVPTRRERHIRRLFGDARIEANWRDIPTPAHVKSELQSRMEAKIQTAVDADADGEAPERAALLAQELLARKSAEEVVTALIGLVPYEAKAEPLDLGVPLPWAEMKAKQKKDRRDRGDRGDRGDRRFGRDRDRDRGGRFGRDDRGRGSYGDDRRGPRREDRGFGGRRDDRGFGRKDDRGFGGRPDDRGFGRKDDRGFGGRRDERGGYGRDRQDDRGRGRSYGYDRDDRRGGYNDRRDDRSRSYGRGGDDRRGGGYRDRGNERRGGYEDRRGGYERRPREDRGPEAGYTRYEINWGRREGANPRRILAMVCRRGEVNGQDIGSIRVNEQSTSFEIKKDRTSRFESSIRKPDPRDPHLKIRKSFSDR